MTSASRRPAWPTVELGSHVDLQTGFPFKSSGYTEGKSDVRLLRGDNVGQGSLRWSGVKKWPAADFTTYSNFNLQEGDVILAMDRPWIPAGLKYAWVKETDLPCLLVQRVARLRGINGLLTSYLRYVIGSRAFTEYVQSITTGVNVPHISGRDIKAFRFPLPPKDTQRRIAGILSAYDDLIENNERRIAILEEMARRVFREWFVDFRFPGHEAVRMVDTEAGRIPEGWRRRPLGEVADLMGRSVSPSATPEEVFAHYSLPAFDTGRRPTLEPGAAIQSNKLLFQPPAVLVTKLNPRFDRTWLVEEAQPHSQVCSTEYLPLKPKSPVSAAFLHCTVSSKDFRDTVLGLAQGTSTSHQRAKPGDMLRIPVVVPSTDLLGLADRHLSPLLRGAEKLRRSAFVLKNSRDLLLPRLISGELNIATAERMLEAAE